MWIHDVYKMIGSLRKHITKTKGIIKSSELKWKNKCFLLYRKLKKKEKDLKTKNFYKIISKKKNSFHQG